MKIPIYGLAVECNQSYNLPVWKKKLKLLINKLLKLAFTKAGKGQIIHNHVHKTVTENIPSLDDMLSVCDTLSPLFVNCSAFSERLKVYALTKGKFLPIIPHEKYK